MNRISKGKNCTLIVLIPKVKKVQSFNHFRHINLCDVAYKVVSKILSNCLKPFLT